MCGICGKVAWEKERRVDAGIVRQMMDRIVHRGPDDDGVYDGGQVVLGHRRLSIIDLNTGKQPIANEDRNIWVVYNGEIYNFVELREGLQAKGHIFATNTDTEVIIHLYEEHGDDFVSHLEGMFAFALWDVRKKRLVLARDRVGIKPLYYCATQDALLFASEVKALLVDSTVRRELDTGALDRFLTFGYLPGSSTLISNVQKLEPGHYLTFQDGKITIRQYWDLEFSSPRNNGHFKEASENLVGLLRKSVRNHMISDVPVGVLLSGGVDSTALLSFAVEETGEVVNTFTIGFPGEEFADERYYAKLAAERYGSKHYDMTITGKDFVEFLPTYVWHMEEPVCEPPAAALYFVTKLARKHVKVLISGEGGDEAFAGYQNYRSIMWLELFKQMGAPFTHLAAGAFGMLGRGPRFHQVAKYSTMTKSQLPDYYYSRASGPHSYFNRTKTALYQTGFMEQMRSSESAEYVHDLFRKVADQSPLNQMLYVDTKTWLPDDLLIKADKITMANSLELRVPLLDHHILEFASHLPDSYKIHGFTTKYILKKCLRDRIPTEILRRRKEGFPLPYESWFRNEAGGFVNEILTDRKTVQRGYFEPKAIQDLIHDKTSRSRHAAEIFSLVTLELWHRQFLDSPN